MPYSRIFDMISKSQVIDIKKKSRIEETRKYPHQLRRLNTNFSKTIHRIFPRFCKVSFLIITNYLKQKKKGGGKFLPINFWLLA